MQKIFKNWINKNGVWYKPGYVELTTSEQEYIKARKIEGRLYSDDELKNLPNIYKSHQYAKEWRVRKRSYKQLLKSYQKKLSQLHVLDLGCGNAWMSNKFSIDINAEVWAVDINQAELEQAARTFTNENLHLIYADIFDKSFDECRFDIIIMAASVQYFKDIKKLIHRLFSLLQNGGQIHFIDTIFYADKDLIEAKMRSVKYYNNLGVKDMERFYFHHALSSLNGFNYRIIRSQLEIWKRLINPSPFYYIIIYNPD